MNELKKIVVQVFQFFKIFCGQLGPDSKQKFSDEWIFPEKLWCNLGDCPVQSWTVIGLLIFYEKADLFKYEITLLKFKNYRNMVAFISKKIILVWKVSIGLKIRKFCFLRVGIFCAWKYVYYRIKKKMLMDWTLWNIESQ